MLAWQSRKRSIVKEGFLRGHSRPLFLYFRLFWIAIYRYTDLWCWKRPLCQLRHKHGLSQRVLSAHLFVTHAFRPGGYLQLDCSHYLSTLKKDSLGREVNLGSLGFSFFTLQSSALDNSATVPSLFTFFCLPKRVICDNFLLLALL